MGYSQVAEYPLTLEDDNISPIRLSSQKSFGKFHHDILSKLHIPRNYGDVHKAFQGNEINVTSFDGKLYCAPAISSDKVISEVLPTKTLRLFTPISKRRFDTTA
jgi:hypothetical protein